MSGILSLLVKILPDPLKGIDDAIAVSRYGRGVKLTWAYGAGWSGADVERLLNKYGIRAYARQYAGQVGDDYGCRVRTEQGRWAERVCRQAGVPLTNPLIDESNRNAQAGQGMPQEWGVPVAPVGLAGLLMGRQTTTQRRQARKSQRRQRRGTR